MGNQTTKSAKTKTPTKTKIAAKKAAPTKKTVLTTQEKEIQRAKIRNKPAFKNAIAGILIHQRQQNFVVDNARWYCGISQDLKVRFKQHSKERLIYYPQKFMAYTNEIAHEVEVWAHENGFANYSTGRGNDSSTIVYIFKLNPNFLERLINLDL